jgi:hypothetical protein
MDTNTASGAKRATGDGVDSDLAIDPHRRRRANEPARFRIRFTPHNA